MTWQVVLERATKWVQDLGRTLDYLESRADIEAGHLPLTRADLIRETLEWLDRYHGPVVR